MLITSFDQIKQLFDGEITESQYLDYKKEIYRLTKDQKGSEEKKDKDKFELLKDVGSFLNSDSGTIVLGIKDDGKTGSPLEAIEDSGILNSEFPSGYEELIERQINTGFSPICQISIKRIANNLHKDHSFLVINIPIQHSPLFAVIRGKNGEDLYSLFVRRGRNIGIMDPIEIRNRIDDFSRRSSYFTDRIKNLSSNIGADALKPLFISYPINPLSFDALEQEDRLRGTCTWENGGCKVTHNEINVFPQPTLEGIEMTYGQKQLHLYEDGFITWTSNRLDGERIMLTNSSGTKIRINHILIWPNDLVERITNFARFSLQTYSELGYFGEFTICIKIIGCKGSLLCLRSRDYIFAKSDAESHDGFLSYDGESNPYGPKQTKNQEISISLRVSTFNLHKDNLSDLDDIIRKRVLDYIWRAYGFSKCLV